MHRKYRYSAVAVLSALSLATPALLTAAPGATAAQAGGWERCPVGNICLFDGHDGTGSMAWFRSGSPDLRRQGMDKRASSVWNRHEAAFALTDDYDYDGECTSIFPDAKANLTTFDNRASSVRLYACG